MSDNKKTTKLIDRAYAALDENTGHYRDKIYNLAAAGERAHRRVTGVPGGYQCSVATAAKLFTVRWLVRYATYTREVPTVQELLSMRDDAALAAMVAENYREEILKALHDFDLEQLLALDYVALIEKRAE